MSVSPAILGPGSPTCVGILVSQKHYLHMGMRLIAIEYICSTHLMIPKHGHQKFKTVVICSTTELRVTIAVAEIYWLEWQVMSATAEKPSQLIGKESS